MAKPLITSGHTITVDELRACGALDCPPEWRKSMIARTKAKQPPERDLFSDLVDDDEPEVVAQGDAVSLNDDEEEAEEE